MTGTIFRFFKSLIWPMSRPGGWGLYGLYCSLPPGGDRDGWNDKLIPNWENSPVTAAVDINM